MQARRHRFLGNVHPPPGEEKEMVRLGFTLDPNELAGAMPHRPNRWLTGCLHGSRPPREPHRVTRTIARYGSTGYTVESGKKLNQPNQ